MSQWRENSRLVMFQTLHRGQRDTRLCTYLIRYANFYLLPLPQPRGSYVSTPSCTIPAHHFPPPLPSPPFPLTSPNQCLPVPTTASTPVPPGSSPLPCRGPEAITYQFNAQLYSAFTGCTSPSSQTLPLLEPPTLRCTPTYRLPAANKSAPPVSAPPGPVTPLVPVPCRG